MILRNIITASSLSLLLAQSAIASDQVLGTSTAYTSPNGVAEACVAITPVPGGSYSNHDSKTEAEYCAIDLYAPSIGLCPKIWSTSPGMVVYDLSSGRYANDPASFMHRACSDGKGAEDVTGGKLVKYKPTMNAEGTSGTFSASSLLYYHLSRYLDTTVTVPVAVWRSMDRQAHLDLVANSGLALSSSARMNHAGWTALANADRNPSSYSPMDELFTADRSAIYGVFVNSPGHRYSSEINGTRASGWGKGQNRDFQKTVPFMALRSEEALIAAIASGLHEGQKDPKIRHDTQGDTSDIQIAFWMRELSEIVVMDYIFSQQDRIGNIDFTPYWVWVEDGEIKSMKVHKHAPDGRPKGVPESAILLKRTQLNDNDAGGRVAYANFTKSTEMLEKLRHFNGDVYTKLLAMNADFAAKGALYSYFSTSFGLSDRQMTQMVKNTTLAVGILQNTCEQGNLTFDLEPEELLVSGSVTPKTVACSGG